MSALDRMMRAAGRTPLSDSGPASHAISDTAATSDLTRTITAMVAGGGRGAGSRLMVIAHDPIPERAEYVTRRAVRAIVADGPQLLMVHSRTAGDYKFPGGGVEPGEAPATALIREVAEECGRLVTEVSPAVLTVIESRNAREPGLVFQSHSTYHVCTVDGPVHPVNLDDYEQELGFRPTWVDLDSAISTNEQVLAAGTAQTWVHRETQVLRWLRDPA